MSIGEFLFQIHNPESCTTNMFFSGIFSPPCTCQKIVNLPLWTREILDCGLALCRIGLRPRQRILLPTLGPGKVKHTRVWTSFDASHLNGGPSSFHQDWPCLAWRLTGLTLVGGAGSPIKSALEEGLIDDLLDKTGVG